MCARYPSRALVRAVRRALVRAVRRAVRRFAARRVCRELPRSEGVRLHPKSAEAPFTDFFWQRHLWTCGVPDPIREHVLKKLKRSV